MLHISCILLRHSTMVSKGPVPRGDESFEILLVGGVDRPAPTDQFEKGTALADDQTCYFIIGCQEKLYFGQKLEYKVATN